MYCALGMASLSNSLSLSFSLSLSARSSVKFAEGLMLLAEMAWVGREVGRCGIVGI